jgi:hypothetical protein
MKFRFFIVQYPAQKLGLRFFCPKPPSGWSEKFKSLFLEKGHRLKKLINFPDQEKVKRHDQVKMRKKRPF